MWMMGCNDGGEICLPTNNDGGRKLRPLIPRPPPIPSAVSPEHNNNSHHHHGRGNHNHGVAFPDPDRSFFAMNQHHLVTMAEQSKREFNAAHQVVVSSRWNPTPEQLRALEDLYRRGTRTPSADQIQQITSQLRRYGKIEGKNVFYWFQNHKARERQKRRRQIETFGQAEDENENENGYLSNRRETGNMDCKQSGGSRKTASGDVQRANNHNNKNTPNIINNDSSNTCFNWGSAEGSNMDRGGKSAAMAAAAGVVEVGGGGGGGSASASSSAAAADAAVKTTSTSLASSTAVVTSLWMKLNDTAELLLPNPITSSSNLSMYPCPLILPTNGCGIVAPSCSASPPLPFPGENFQTLQLFPLRSENEEDGYDDKETDRDNFTGSCHNVAEDDNLRRQFFEFLPMKN